jgi:hypothetical protein
LSSSDTGIWTNGVVSWPAFALEPGKTRVFTVTVKVNEDAPTNNFTGTSPHNGLASATRLTNADITNIVSFTMITADPDTTDNVYQEPTNVLPKLEVTAQKVWVGGPSEDHVAVELTLSRQVLGGQIEVVAGSMPVITPNAGNADVFDYRWTGLPTFDPQGREYIYTVEETVVPDNYTKTTSGNIITNTYKPSLILIKFCGDTLLQGAEFQLYMGNSNGIIGVPDRTVTTDANGQAVFAHLVDGIYWIVESKAPSGYKYVDNIGPFVVKDGKITGPEGYTPLKDDTTGDYSISVEDEPVRELPATGGVGTIPYMGAGFALLILAIALKSGYSGRSSKHNNIV